MPSSTALPHDAPPKQSSIVAHPWFPKMIGLWFAALFGLCSLALAPGMLERIVTTLGIDRIFPAAAPPLGQTARLLLALGMAGVGEIAGLLIGARLATPKRAEPGRRRGFKTADEAAEDAPQLRDRDRHPDAPARKPLSASRDLGVGEGETLSGIDNALRRRALASETDHEPRAFIEVAPLPGDGWPTIVPAESGIGAVVEPVVERGRATVPPFADPVGDKQAASVEALDLARVDEPPAIEVPRSQMAPFAEPRPEPSDTFVADEPRMAEAIPSGPASSDIATASLERLGVVQLSERLALALQARRERRAVAAVAPSPTVGITTEDHADFAPAAIAPTAPPVVSEGEPLTETFIAPPPAPTPFPVAPFAAEEPEEEAEIPALARSLSMPRLGSVASAAVEAPTVPVAPELERGLEILARRAPKPPVEDAVAPEAGDQDEPSPGDESDELAEEVLEEGYSSLLAMGVGSPRAEAVRIEEPHDDEIEPVVIFPGQGARALGEAPTALGAPFARPGAGLLPTEPASLTDPAGRADSEETDRALRAALASLQRISGAR